MPPIPSEIVNTQLPIATRELPIGMLSMGDAIDNSIRQQAIDNLVELKDTKKLKIITSNSIFYKIRFDPN